MIIIPLIALITGFLVGHYTPVPVTSHKLPELEQCVQQQIDLYGDICAEARSCEDYNNPDTDNENPYCTNEEADKRGSATLVIESHFEGVQCAVESIKICMESN